MKPVFNQHDIDRSNFAIQNVIHNSNIAITFFSCYEYNNKCITYQSAL